nr:ribonuclease H-like domain-containing protein [Tanacetum cinerariifolium]
PIVSLSPQVVAAAKLHILNPNEFDLWKMRIEKYFLMTDYSLWEVILNGDSPTPTIIIDGVVQVIAPTTAEQRLAKKNELKARGTLLMALPDKHHLKFNIYKDDKSLMEAVEKRLQKLISQLEILGESISQEDINIKFLRSLPSEWKTHTLIWRNKADLEKQSLDDLLNNLKIYEAEAPVSTLLNVDNLSDAVIYSFFASHSTSPQLDNEDLKQIDADDLEEMNFKWQMAMLTMRASRFLQRTGRNLGANGTTAIGFDMSKVECYNCHRRGHFSRECRSPRENRNKDTPRRTILVEVSTSNALVSQCDGVELRKKFEKAKKERDELKHTLEKFQTSFKNISKLLESQITDKTSLGYDHQVFNNQVFDCHKFPSFESDDSVLTSSMHNRYKSSEEYHVVPPPYTGTFMPSKPDLVFHDGPPTSETVPIVVNVKYSTNKSSKDMSKTLRLDAPIIKDWTFDSEDKFEHESIGCSRHMTGNISFLSDFEEINEGYVAFGGKPKGDTECVVLSSNFKFPDENHVLRRVSRENNMYNVDLKNVVSLGDLTCFFAKATLDESNIWHRRLGHINFKTMNKLVKGNLVRGLPSKVKRIENKAKTAEAVNTACYVLNRVLVTKPHNKTPYELLLGRTPGIGFMRPLRCPVTILNTLDPLIKFDGKADEGFLVGYSVNSKAFRVFNSRTRIVQETLHINFLKNQPNVTGMGPKWLFDIDTLTQSMNY